MFDILEIYIYQVLIVCMNAIERIPRWRTLD